MSSHDFSLVCTMEMCFSLELLATHTVLFIRISKTFANFQSFALTEQVVKMALIKFDVPHLSEQVGKSH